MSIYLKIQEIQSKQQNRVLKKNEGRYDVEESGLALFSQHH